MATINHEDIWIKSDESVSWEQSFNSSLNYNNLNINSSDYTDYKPTRLQFILSSSTASQDIQVKIKCANRLTKTHLKHATVCKYDTSTKQWAIIKTTYREAEKTLEFSTTTIGIYGVFINRFWYSSLTQRLANEYPNWTKIRSQKGSTGQKFLNYFGLELEEVQDYLEWISEQKYITTADVQVLDWVKMYTLPDIKESDTVQIYDEDNKSIPILDTIREFFYNDRNEGVLIDYQERKAYATKNHETIKVKVTRNSASTMLSVDPLDYHIWNVFDEFGLLLGVQRLHLEKNAALKERILDVFRYPAGSHDIGLTNGIGRELNLIQRYDKAGRKLVWSDDSKDFYLKNSSGKIVDYRTLRVDNLPLSPDMYTIDSMGSLRIFAMDTGKSHNISFIYGIEKFELYDKKDESLYQMMFDASGQSTSVLLKWVEYINTVSPVMWDYFRWDEAFWDTTDKKLTGLGYVPNLWDSDIEIWKAYEFNSEI